MNALHPRNPPAGDVARHLDFVAASGSWNLVHWGIGLSAVLLLAPLLVLTLTLRDSRGDGWARLGMAVSVIAAVLWVLIVTMEVALKRVADAPARDPATVAAARVLFDLTDSLLTTVIIVHWLATLSFGVAMVLTSHYPRWLSWSALLHAVAMLLLIGAPRALAGATPFADNVLFPLLATVSLAWVLLLGVVFWRRVAIA